MSLLIVSCLPEDIVLAEIEKDDITQEDIDSYRSCKCNMNASHQVKVTLDGIVKSFSTPQPPTIPDVTPRQIRQALILSGVSLTQIDAALASLPEPNKSLAQAEWEYSIAFQRNRPLVASVAVMLGWTSQQLDALWLFAGTL